MRLLHKNQRGFTLIELMIAIGITGLIASGIVTAIFQVFNVSTLSTNHMLALRQVQNAGYWISHDAQMAQFTDAESDDIDEGDPANPDDNHPLWGQAAGQTQVLLLSWVGWERIEGQGPSADHYIDTYEVYYTYYDNKLWRYQRITTNKYNSSGQLEETTYSPGPTDEDDWGATFIADYITEEPSIVMDGGKLVVTIEATVGRAEEIRTYEISPRPGS